MTTAKLNISLMTPAPVTVSDKNSALTMVDTDARSFDRELAKADSAQSDYTDPAAGKPAEAKPETTDAAAQQPDAEKPDAATETGNETPQPDKESADADDTDYAVRTASILSLIGQPAAPVVVEEATPTQPAAEIIGAPTEAVETLPAVEAVLDKPLAEPTNGVDLQSLIPATGDETVNRDLMAQLSGIHQGDVKASLDPQAAAQTPAVDTGLEALLPATEGAQAELGALSGGLMQNAAKPLVNSATNPLEAKPAKTDETAILSRTGLVVEDDTMPVLPVTGQTQADGQLTDLMEQPSAEPLRQLRQEKSPTSDAEQPLEDLFADAVELPGLETAAKTEPKENTPSNTVAAVSAPAIDTAAATDAPAAPAPVAETADVYRIQQQIVDQVRLIRDNSNTELVIRLNPRHLGDLTLRISVDAQGEVSAQFRSDSAHVRAVIEGAMAELKQELRQQGVKVENVSVSAELSEDFFRSESQLSQNGQSGQQTYDQNQSTAAATQDARNRLKAEEESGQLAGSVAATATEPVAAGPVNRSATGVDYSV